MWQLRSLYLACLCWLLVETTDSNNTVYVTQGSQSVISCPLSPVLNKTQWIGPPGNTFYNLPGTTILNVDALPTDFVSRLAVHPQTGALIINNTQRSDENWYRCKIGGAIANVRLRVFVSPKPPFIANTLANNSLGRMVVWAMEDSSVSLVCDSKGGDPQPSLKWIKGGVTGSEISANYSLQNNTNGTYDVTSTTTVMTYRSEDRVTYVCQANHTTWSSPQNASVELYLYHGS